MKIWSRSHEAQNDGWIKFGKVREQHDRQKKLKRQLQTDKGKKSFVRSLSDLKKLLVDTMYDYTKIILQKLYVPSYLNLYVTLQNACELTNFWGGFGLENLKNVYHFTSFKKFKILMSSKDKTLGKLCLLGCVICNHTQYMKRISFRETKLEYHQNASNHLRTDI